MKNKGIIFFIFTGLLFSVVLFQCKGKSEEDLLQETVEKIGDNAEARELSGILHYIAEDYSDEEGRTLEEVKTLLETYLQGYRGIAVNALGTKILSLTVPEAELETDVALSSGAAKLFRKAVRYAGQFYRFKMTWIKKEETWKCKSASWRSITLEELFPESSKILEKLFPGTF
jgi:hypothetical protein